MCKVKVPIGDIVKIVRGRKVGVLTNGSFWLEEAGTVEPKPGISPTPKHVTELVKMMRTRKVRIVLAANYFDEQKIRTVASRVGAEAVIVPLYVGGAQEIDDYFELVDHWVDRLLNAAHNNGLIETNDKE